MADIIIVLILIVIAVFAIKQTKKHMHGESPCCGGGSGTVKKVKEKHLDGPVMGTKTMKIKGMTCEHCVNNVTNAINQVAGASAKVSLKDKQAIISYDRELSNIELRKAVEDAALTYKKYIAGEEIAQPPSNFQKAGNVVTNLFNRRAGA